jgi:co-chaperonin GroES (HSP10)
MIQPIRKNVLVICFDGDAVSKGGIIVPDAFKAESNKVKVIAVGKLVKGLKKGDIGHRVKDWGEAVIEYGQKYYIMDESAIIALQ